MLMKKKMGRVEKKMGRLLHGWDEFLDDDDDDDGDDVIMMILSILNFWLYSKYILLLAF